MTNTTCDRLFALIKTNIKEISKLRNSHSQLIGRVNHLEEKLGAEIRSNSEQISSFLNNWESELKLINDQLDSSFGYVDTSMDLIFLAKAKEIDEHFEAAFTHIDSQVNKKKKKMALR